MSRLGVESRISDPVRFVRDSGVIAYVETRMTHAMLAIEEGLGMHTNDTFQSMEVDDAGLIMGDPQLPESEGGLVFFYTSQTCRIRGNRTEAREATVLLAQRITGRPVRSE